MTEQAGGEAAFIDPARFRHSSQFDRRLAIVRSLVGEADHREILDAGCGDRPISLALLTARSRLTLVDTSPTMIRRASEAVPDRHRDRVDLVQGAIADLDGTSRYDLVLAIGVLAHVADLPGTLATLAALVSPTGRAVVQLTDAATVPGAATYAWSRLTRERRGYRLNRLTERRIVSVLAHHGMQLVGRARYATLYRRGSRPSEPPPGRFRRIVQRAADPLGGEKFLAFEPSDSPGPIP